MEEILIDACMTRNGNENIKQTSKEMIARKSRTQGH